MTLIMERILNDENFIVYVEEYTRKKLVHKEDLKKLISIVNQNGKEEIFHDLVFTAKYICGMMRVVKNAQAIPEVQNLDQIKVDLNENIKKGAEKLREIISSGDGVQLKYFENNYLNLTAQSFSNLSELFSDLEAIKKYLNYRKRLSE